MHISLLTSQRGGTTVTQTYAANDVEERLQPGGAGSYVYAPARPHAVSQLQGVDGLRHCYGYDGAGNQLTHRTTTSSGNCATASTMMRTMTYEVGHRPETISGGPSYQSQKLLFRYDGSGDRYIQRQYGSSSPTLDSKITLYPFAGYEVELQRSGLTWSFKEGRQMLGDWGLWRASVTLPQGERIWRHGDRLGSPVAKSDETGVNLERHGFDAWGAARQGNGTPRPQGRLESTYSPRGFTGHEHLDAVGGVIHMNGRGYDANLGRFLSVDPIIAFPANSQSFNPYSYILNNPMSGTDPTGYCPTGTRIGSMDCKEMGVRTIHINPQGSSGGGNGSSKSSANGAPDTHSRQSTAPRDGKGTNDQVPTNQPQSPNETTGSKGGQLRTLNRRMREDEKHGFMALVHEIREEVVNQLSLREEQEASVGPSLVAIDLNQSKNALASADILDMLDVIHEDGAAMTFGTGAISRNTPNPAANLTVYKGAYETYLYGSAASGAYNLSLSPGRPGLVGMVTHESGHGVYRRNYSSIDGELLPTRPREIMADDWARTVWSGAKF